MGRPASAVAPPLTSVRYRPRLSLRFLSLIASGDLRVAVSSPASAMHFDSAKMINERARRAEPRGSAHHTWRWRQESDRAR